MQSTSRQAEGTVGVESFQGRLQLRLSRQLFDGKQKYLSLGLPDTSINRKAAEAKAKVIESDIAFERFITTLIKYGKAKSPHLRAVEALQARSMEGLGLWMQNRANMCTKRIEQIEAIEAERQQEAERVAHEQAERDRLTLPPSRRIWRYWCARRRISTIVDAGIRTAQHIARAKKSQFIKVL